MLSRKIKNFWKVKSRFSQLGKEKGREQKSLGFYQNYLMQISMRNSKKYVFLKLGHYGFFI